MLLTHGMRVLRGHTRGSISLVVLSTALCSCSQQGQLCIRCQIANDSPEALFAAYADCVISHRYGQVEELFVPSLRSHVARALSSKANFDKQTLFLSDEIRSRYGEAIRQEFLEGIVQSVETVFRRALCLREEAYDFAAAGYAQQGDVVVAALQGVPFGLGAVEREGKWFLWRSEPDSWIEDLKYLQYLLAKTNAFLERTRRGVVAGRVGTDKIREILSRPDLSGYDGGTP